MVERDNGRLLAVCGDRPARCDTIELVSADLEVLTFDRDLFLADLRALLGLAGPRQHAEPTEVLTVGVVPIQAGVGLGVFLALNDRAGLGQVDLPELKPDQIRGLLLTLSGNVVATGQWRQVALQDFIWAGPNGEPALSNAGILALDGAKQAAWDEFSPRDIAAWRLPRDGDWGEIQVEFTADAVANFRFRGLTRRFEPEQLGMKDGRTGQPTSQWVLLRVFAEGNGFIPPKRTREHPKFLKHKQELSASLRLHFGLPDDPIPYDKRTRTFTTKFVIRDHRPKARQNENSF